MSATLKRLKKRHGTKVEIHGETFHVRSMNMGELTRLDAISKLPEGATEEQQTETAKLRTALYYGFVLCEDEGGESICPKQEGESDLEWAKRLMIELADIETETLRLLNAAVTKIGTQPSAETIVKN